jgi:hypothetical protein
MTASLGRKTGLFLVLILAASSLFALNVNKLPPDNWAAPATWSPARSRTGLSAQDVTNPLPFIGLAPCRLVDTRGNGAPITGGIFTGGADVRSYAVSGICGIPIGARALSLNFTVTGPGQTVPGFLLAWPTGGAVPPVSILNWDHVQAQLANAAIVPVNSSVSFTVNVSAPTHVIIDVNGYYPDGDASLLLAPGERFDISGSTGPPFGIITGRNNDGSTNARTFYGISVDIPASTFGYAHTAGRFETATGNGVVGITNAFGDCGVIGDQDDSSGAFAARGILGCLNIGVIGQANLTSGIHFGVDALASTTAARSAGVRGRDGAGVTTENSGFFSAGVYGLGRNGVLGESSTVSGDGVVGASLDSSGGLVGQGVLGNGSHGVWAFTGDIGCSGCVKAFVDPHPTDASKQIRFVSLEGNEAGTYFRGTAETFGREFVIQVPEDFRLVTDSDGMTVQLTPVGAPANMYVVSEDLNQIVVRSSRDVKFHYLVQGVRSAFKNVKTIIDMTDFLPQTPDGRMPDAWPEQTKQRLIANGTYNKDGTINMDTAERVGWAQKWREAEEASAQSARARTESARSDQPGGKNN